MDINDIRSLVTLASFLAFVAIVRWAYGARRRDAFDQAARSVLEEPDEAAGAAGDNGERR